jgi:hypothetical protein
MAYIAIIKFFIIASPLKEEWKGPCTIKWAAIAKFVEFYPSKRLRMNLSFQFTYGKSQLRGLTLVVER